MSAKTAVLIVAGALAGAWALSRAADAVAEQQETDWTILDYTNPFLTVEKMVNQSKTSEAIQDANVRAFLTMIARAEGTQGQTDPYRVTFGYAHTIKSFADHPAVTGEWRGRPLSNQQCAGAGLGPGCVSSAAGRYQIVKGTWLACKRALGLTDFGPESQDRAAVYLIKQRGALDAVRAGRIEEAMALCRREWASFPNAGYAGQGTRSVNSMLAWYEQAGGNLS